MGQGEVTPSPEEPKEQAQEETHNRRADIDHQEEHTNRDYPGVETFRDRLEEERNQTERLNIQL